MRHKGFIFSCIDLGMQPTNRSQPGISTTNLSMREYFGMLLYTYQFACKGKGENSKLSINVEKYDL